MTNHDPKIVYHKNGALSALVGKEAISLMRIQSIITGLEINIRTKGRMQLTKSATSTNLLKWAGEYTKIKYKRTEKQKAVDDLRVFFQLLKSSIPTETLDD